MKRILAGSMVVFGASLIGCSTHSDAPYYGSEPVQSGYSEYPPSDYAVVNDPYYGRGAYEGNYWVWHDRDGHQHREARNAHAQRERAYQQHHGEQQLNRGDNGDVHNEGNRSAESGAHANGGAEGQSAGHPEAGRGGPSAHPGAEGHEGGAGGEPHGEGGADHGDADGAHR